MHSYLETRARSIFRMDDDLNADNIPVHDSEILRMSCGSAESDACELIVTCKPHYNVRILGACIVCEARTIECYSKTEGYIQSCRGDAVVVQDLNEKDEEPKELYHSRLKLENPESEITLKVQYLTLNPLYYRKPLNRYFYKM